MQSPHSLRLSTASSADLAPLVAQLNALQLVPAEPASPLPAATDWEHNINLLPFLLPESVPAALESLHLQTRSAAEVAAIISMLPEGTRDLNLQGVSCGAIDFSSVPTSIRNVTVTNIDQAQLDDLVNRCPSLEKLSLRHSNGVENLAGLSNLNCLVNLSCYRCSGFSDLPAKMDHLQSLEIHSCSSVKELPHFSKYPQLRVLRASFCSQLHRFHMIPKHHGIQVVDLRHNYNLKEIPPIVSENLVELNCVAVQAKQALTFGSCPRLELLNLSFCRKLLNVFGLNAERVPRLFRAELRGTYNNPAMYLAMQKIPRWVFLRT